MTHSKQGQPLEVSIRGLTHSFQEGDQEHAVLRDLDVDIVRGETIALRGRSGSGKSTLLNLISGIDVSDIGTIIVAGKNVTSMSERERTLFRRKHIGFVYQAFNLVPTLTVSDNVQLVLELNGIDQKQAQARTQSVLDAVDLADRAKSYPDVLSGGEQQRVAIARALVHEPALVLADEPTGNLDEQTAAGVLRLLDELVTKVAGTMIIATHSAAVAGACDRILELRNGVFHSGRTQDQP